MKKIKIFGFCNDHDSNYCILENGIPIIHNEMERITRIKQTQTNVLPYSKILELNDIDYCTSIPFGLRYWPKYYKEYKLLQNKYEIIIFIFFDGICIY